MESSIVRSKEFPLKDNWKKFTPTLSQVKSLMKNDHLKRRAYVKSAIEEQKANGKYEGIIINAGGYSHTSVAIRDSLALFSGLIIEVHISNIYGREEFRHTSMISSISNGVIVGLGAQSYNLAMRAIAESFLTE